jgi:hypothetical protein
MVRGVDLASKRVFSIVVLWEGVDGEGKFIYAPEYVEGVRVGKA